MSSLVLSLDQGHDTGGQLIPKCNWLTHHSYLTLQAVFRLRVNKCTRGSRKSHIIQNKLSDIIPNWFLGQAQTILLKIM